MTRFMLTFALRSQPYVHACAGARSTRLVFSECDPARSGQVRLVRRQPLTRDMPLHLTRCAPTQVVVAADADSFIARPRRLVFIATVYVPNGAGDVRPRPYTLALRYDVRRHPAVLADTMSPSEAATAFLWPWQVAPLTSYFWLRSYFLLLTGPRRIRHDNDPIGGRRGGREPRRLLGALRVDLGGYRRRCRVHSRDQDGVGSRPRVI